MSRATAVSLPPKTSAAHSAAEMRTGSTPPDHRSGSVISRNPVSAAAPGPSNLAGFTRWVCTSITTDPPATVEAGVGGGAVDLGLGRERAEAAAGGRVDGP
ncbi:MAG TPA: hypothetical protein VHK25_08500, partial [Acidimicrobiales bacterium]|nr:hypothetical protein [Acidimicrobiales bacterium]